MRPRARRNQGFTLLELLIVVAVIGIISTLLIPNLIDALHKSKQKQTLGNMKEVGTAWFSWLTDEVSAAAAGSTQTFDFGIFSEALTAEELLTTLYPEPDHFYINYVPPRDGWGYNFEYRWTGNSLGSQVAAIRSFGRDGMEGPSPNPYTMGPFNATAYDEDIVWADGLFIQYPSGARVQ